MKPDLENLKEYTHKTSLTQEEKFAMLQSIRNYTDTHPIKTPSYSIFFKHSFAYASMFALIIGTSATSFAAEDSLPGDILYPVKTEINEVIAKTLAITETQKAKVNVKLVDKRMEELTEMVVTQKDTPEKIDVIALKLEEHKQELQKYIEEVKVTDIKASEDAVAIYTELESVVDVHLDILEDIQEDTQATTTLVNTIDINSTTTPALMLKKENIKPNETSLSTSTEKITGEQDAVLEILDFSAKLEPILMEAKSKAHKEDDKATSIKIKQDTRRRIIDKVKEEFQIDIEKEVEEKEEVDLIESIEQI